MAFADACLGEAILLAGFEPRLRKSGAAQGKERDRFASQVRHWIENGSSRNRTLRGRDKSGRRVVSAFIATAFAQDTPEAASTQWRRVAKQLRPTVPKLEALLDEAEQDVVAYMTLETIAPMSDNPNILLSAVPGA